MQVTVLGKSPSWQDAGGACSGYLVQHDGFTVLLDCGNGVFSKLRAVIDYRTVDAVIISHLHADHFFDLVPYSYALTNGPRTPKTRPRLLVAPHAPEGLRRLSGCVGAEDLIQGAFALDTYEAGAPLRLGPLTVRFCAVPHFVPTHAIEVSQADGARFTFGADCRPNRALEGFAQATDLLLLEATLTSDQDPAAAGHLTPRQAGQLGAAAGARRLVLTHFSDEMDPAWAAEQGATGYGAPVTLAHERAVYRV